MKEIIQLLEIETGETWYFYNVAVMLATIRNTHEGRPISLKNLVVYNGAIAIYTIKPVYIIEQPDHL